MKIPNPVKRVFYIVAITVSAVVYIGLIFSCVVFLLAASYSLPSSTLQTTAAGVIVAIVFLMGASTLAVRSLVKRWRAKLKILKSDNVGNTELRASN